MVFTVYITIPVPPAGINYVILTDTLYLIPYTYTKFIIYNNDVHYEYFVCLLYFF